MSTPASDATTPVPVVTPPAAPGADDEVGGRGRLDIASGVVRRIAEHAADSKIGRAHV